MTERKNMFAFVAPINTTILKGFAFTRTDIRTHTRTYTEVPKKENFILMDMQAFTKHKGFSGKKIKKGENRQRCSHIVQSWEGAFSWKCFSNISLRGENSKFNASEE